MYIAVILIFCYALVIPCFLYALSRSRTALDKSFEESEKKNHDR
jgi:hypothetical protein